VINNENNNLGTSIIFVDAKPSEQIQIHEDSYLCFASLSPSISEGVSKLKQYKATKKSKKAVEALRITKLIKSGGLPFNSVFIAGKMTGQFINWAIESLNRNKDELGISWEQPESSSKPIMLWKGKSINIALATGLSLYTNMLACLVLKYAIIASKQGKIGHLKVALDNLPNDSALGMELMQALAKTDPDIQEMWSSNQENNISFEIANLKSYQDTDGKQKPAKTNPHVILVDWLAASCIAKLNPKQLKSETGFTNEEIRAIASIIEAAEARGAAQIINVDDPETAEKIINHSEKEKGKINA